MKRVAGKTLWGVFLFFTAFFWLMIACDLVYWLLKA